VALFLLLPVFTMIVSLLYLRRKYNYTENLVFVFHVQTVFFLLLLIFIIIGRIANSQVVIPIFVITFMIYLYKAMRTFYEQGRIKTLIKYILLNSGFLVLALIGGIIISFIAFLI
jgi:4-amino-4-deoxy-L-arabinose transferase-like glycosyltransferase